MSANNQILIKEHGNNWYLFFGVMAESWSEKNELPASRAEDVYDTKEEALIGAQELMNNLEWPDEIEYGIGLNKLFKDGAEVTIV